MRVSGKKKGDIYYLIFSLSIVVSEKMIEYRMKLVSGYVTDFWVRALGRRIIEYRIYIFNWVLFDNLSREVNEKMIEYTIVSMTVWFHCQYKMK